MARRLQILPERRIDPLYRAKSYVDRRVGLFDPARERRRQQALRQVLR